MTQAKLLLSAKRLQPVCPTDGLRPPERCTFSCQGSPYFVRQLVTVWTALIARKFSSCGVQACLRTFTYCCQFSSGTTQNVFLLTELGMLNPDCLS